MVRSPILRRLTGLAFRGATLNPRAVPAFANDPRVGHLEGLTFWSGSLNPAGVTALLESPLFVNLAALGVLLAVALVGVAEMIVYYRWPGFVPSGGRDLVHIGFRDAALVNWMFTQAPGLAEFMGHWVPGVALAQEGRPQT